MSFTAYSATNFTFSRLSPYQTPTARSNRSLPIKEKLQLDFEILKYKSCLLAAAFIAMNNL